MQYYYYFTFLQTHSQYKNKYILYQGKFLFLKTDNKPDSEIPSKEKRNQKRAEIDMELLLVCVNLISRVRRVLVVRWSRYNPYYLEPDVRKEAYGRADTELSAEEKEQRDLKALRPIKAASNSVTSSVFDDPVLRYDKHRRTLKYSCACEVVISFVLAFSVNSSTWWWQMETRFWPERSWRR